MASIVWYSKRQNTVEISTFGPEYAALKIAIELIESLMYILRMFGMPIENEARVLCDNESVVNSSSYPESSLRIFLLRIIKFVREQLQLMNV